MWHRHPACEFLTMMRALQMRRARSDAPYPSVFIRVHPWLKKCFGIVPVKKHTGKMPVPLPFAQKHPAVSVDAAHGLGLKYATPHC
jgi:hypothetical protein